MHFFQPQKTTSPPAKSSFNEAQAEQHPVPFQATEKAIVQRAVGDAGKLCAAAGKVLSDFSAGAASAASKDLHSRVGKLLHGAFGIGTGFAGDSTHVSRLRHLITSIPQRLDAVTYYRVNSPPESLHVATTEPGGRINIKNQFFTLNYTNSQRAIILIHEAIHLVQNAIGFAQSTGGKSSNLRDVTFHEITSHHKIPFEQVVYYPYHYQWFLCELFKIPNPSKMPVTFTETLITPGKS